MKDRLAGLKLILMYASVIAVAVFWVMPSYTLAAKFSGVLLLCCFLALVRVIAGPTAPDRALATDIIGLVIIGFCAMLYVTTRKSFYLDIAIAWALQSFIGMLALAKYLEGKKFDE
ncbi:MAG: multiple resistance and pH regulation protein F [Elusimicrobia bacterium HGW-Elusimicrobia-1]|jgi:multicomponent Na+:H+ antiporter subunit F|nr:MAG: multiple resistance and pH regulation protein F [Elusimicrobia bacterium HGW-Elusimicrobia-1]